jgi:RNA polymerase sigma-70 factor (ECF subfamily)
MADVTNRRLAELFVAHLPYPRRPEPSCALQSLIEERLDLATDRWPGLGYRVEEFLVELAKEIPRGEDPETHLKALKVEDLYLAHACAHEDPAAIAAFEKAYMPDIDAALAEVRAPQHLADEIKQVLRERFLVGKQDRPAAIASYSGRGALSAWVRISALRELYRSAEGRRRWGQLEDAQLARLASPGDDPELDYLKGHYRGEFRAAFSEAMKALSSQERVVLKHYYLDRLGVEQIGAIYQVNKSTVSRWLTRSRQTILEHTRRALMQRLAIDDQELDSVLRLIESRLEVTLSALLGGSGDRAE